MAGGLTPDTRLMALALAGDLEALDALLVEARRRQDAALLRRLIRLRIAQGAPLLVRQDEGEPGTWMALLASGLSAAPIELCEPLSLVLPWDAPRLRLLACDWAEHLAPMYTSEFEGDRGGVALDLDTARRAALGLATPDALAAAHTRIREDADLFSGLWRPADEALAALLGATDPLRPHIAGSTMRTIPVEPCAVSDHPQFSYEETTVGGLAWLAARLERYVIGPAPSLLWVPDLAAALGALDAAPVPDRDALRRALWGIAWLGLEIVLALGDEELALSDLGRGDTLVLEALVDFAQPLRIVAPLELTARWDESVARALAGDLAAAAEPLLHDAPAPLGRLAAAVQGGRDLPEAATALLETSTRFDTCLDALEQTLGPETRWRARGWRTQARLLLARLLGRDPARELDALRGALTAALRATA